MGADVRAVLVASFLATLVQPLLAVSTALARSKIVAETIRLTIIVARYTANQLLWHGRPLQFLQADCLLLGFLVVLVLGPLLVLLQLGLARLRRLIDGLADNLFGQGHQHPSQLRALKKLLHWNVQRELSSRTRLEPSTVWLQQAELTVDGLPCPSEVQFVALSKICTFATGAHVLARNGTGHEENITLLVMEPTEEQIQPRHCED